MTPLTRAAGIALSMALALAVAAPSAFAAPQVDQNSGTWTDNYQDNVGIANIPESSGYRHDPFGQLVTLAPNVSVGQFATVAVSPVSFGEWGRIYIDYTASQTADLDIYFLGGDGTWYPRAPAAGGGFALQASDSAAWKGMVSLSTVPATQLSGRVVVKLRERVIAGDPEVRIRPTVQALRVTWSPRSVVKLGLEAPASTCSNQQYTYKVRVSVSLVNATDLVVWAPIPQAPTDAFGRTYPLAFGTASNAGVYTSSAITVKGNQVPANAVYWDLGTVNAGNTFLLSYSVTPPTGTLNTTTYTATAEGRASNAAAVSAPGTAPVVTTTVSSSPSPFAYKSPGGTYTINNRNYINGGSQLSYFLYVGNYEFPPSTCTEAYHKAVVWDDVSDLVAPKEAGWTAGSVYTTPPGLTINNGGVFTAVARNVNGVSVPANAIYWDLGTIEVGQRHNLSYSMTLKDDVKRSGPLPLDHRIDNTVTLESSFRPQKAQRSAEVYIGIPNNPNGQYAKGDRIRGSAGISGGGNDNWWLSVGYGDPVTWLIYARNGGASSLDNTLMIDKVPAGTTFSSAFLPSNANGTIYYNTTGADRAVGDPPDVTVATGVLGASWTTAAPANAASVKWVAFRIPKLASSYFPDNVTPNAVTGEITVTVDNPVNGCPLATVNNTSLFQTYAYTGVGETVSTPITGIAGWVRDNEPVQVKPVVPSFEGMQIAAYPGALIGSGDVSFTINLPNQQSGGVETDTALDVVVSIAMPKLSINGVLTPLPFVRIDSQGGNVDYAGLPDTLTVRYASIPPSAARTIDVRVNVPRGYVTNSTFSLAATATGRDDVCGPIAASGSRGASVSGNPYLQVAKRVDLGVAAPDSEIKYTLSYVNIGDAVSTGTWIIDRIPADVAFSWAEGVPNQGEVWFSNRAPPALPESLRTDFAPTDAIVRANFARGISIGNGRFGPPASASNPRWIAFLVDNASLSPAQLPIGGLSSVRWAARVREGVIGGTTIRNEAAVFSRELLSAISNEASTVVSNDPSIEVARTCPDVAGAGEDVVWSLDYVNNSTNADFDVVLTEILPSDIEFVSATHTWNAVAAEPYGNVVVTPSRDGANLSFRVTEAIDASGATPLISFQGGRIEVRGRVKAGTVSGTFADIGGLATAKDTTRTLDLSVFTGCRVLVENADLFIRKGVDQARPIAGEVVTYSLIVSNEGANRAENVVVTDTLPAGVTYVAGSARVTTAGWGFAGASEPTTGNGGRTLTWSVAGNNAVRKAGLAAGYFPGRSGDVTVNFQAKIAPTVPPETTLRNDVVTSTSSGEDANKANSAFVEVKTPQPDPYITKTGPSFAQPGDPITYRFRYGNESRQASGPVVIIDKLYDAAPADGIVDVTYVGHTVQNGEQVWFHSASLAGPQPAFSAANPAATGWRASAAGQPVHWIAVYRPTLPGSSGPFSVYLDLALRTPTTGLTPQPGATIPNTATIALIGDNPPNDEDPSNNASTVETKTPGIDIAVDATCTPEGAFPGIVPGNEVAVVFELKNNGTVPAYGLKVAYAVPAWMTKLGDDAATVIVTTATGAEGKLVTETGAPINDPVSWTASGSAYLLGDATSGGRNWYRKVGLPAGAKVQIRVTGTVKPTVANETPIRQDVTVTTDYRFDFVPGVDDTEQILTNNADTCGSVAYRPDPMVIKTATGVSKAAPFTVGDRVRYEIAYNNIGSAPADDVVIEDYLPEGVPFVVGSFTNLPEGTTLRYDDGTGAFTYVPVGGVGQADPGVRAIRVAFNGEVPAPAGATFVQDTSLDFAKGVFSGTKVVDDGQAVGASARLGTYTSPRIPALGEGNVVKWDRVVVDSVVSGQASVTVSVLDGDTGEVLRTGLVPDASGAITLDLDATRVRSIRVRADMVGGGSSCDANGGDEQYVELTKLPTPFNNPSYLYAQGCDANGEVLFQMSDYEGVSIASPYIATPREDGQYDFLALSNGDFSYSYPYWRNGDVIYGYAYRYTRDENFSRAVLWVKKDGAWEFSQLPVPDGIRPGGYSYANDYDAADPSTLFGYFEGSSGSQPAVWRLTDGSYTSEVLPLPEGSIEGYIDAMYRGVAVGRYYVDAWRPVRWTRSAQGVWSAEPIADVASGSFQFIFEDGTYLFNANIDNLNRAGILSKTGDTWNLDLFDVGPGQSFSTQGVTDDYVLAYSHDGSRHSPYFAQRVGGRWELEALPLPEGALGGYPQRRRSDGTLLGRCQTLTGNQWWPCAWSQDPAEMTWVVEVFELPLEGVSNLSDYGTTSQGIDIYRGFDASLGRDSFFAVEIAKGADGDLVATTRRITLGDGIYPVDGWSDYFDSNRQDDRYTPRYACGKYLGRYGADIFVADLAQGSGDIMGRLIDGPGRPATNRASINNESNGHLAGYAYRNYTNEYVGVLWRREEGVGFTEYALQPSEASVAAHPKSAGWYPSNAQVALVAPDGLSAVGYFQFCGPRCEQTATAWVYDAATNCYVAIDLVPASTNTYVWQDNQFTAARRAPLAAQGQLDGNPTVWFYAPRAPNRFVPLGELLPDQNYNNFFGGSDYTVVSTYDSATNLYTHTAFVIDLGSELGLARRTLTGPADMDGNYVYVSFADGDTVVGQANYRRANGAVISRPVIWKRTGTLDWEAHWAFEDDFWSGGIQGVAQVPFAADLPLIAGYFYDDNSSARVMAPDEDGAYHPVTFGVPEGYSSFEPLGGGAWPSLNYYRQGEVRTSGFAFGVVGGTLYETSTGRQVPAIQVPQPDGPWTAVPFPALAGHAASQVRSAGPGPVFYGDAVPDQGGNSDAVGWWFEGGELGQPRLFDLLADGDEDNRTRYEYFQWPYSATDPGGVISFRSQGCGMNGCWEDTNFVFPKADGFTVKSTRPSTQYYGNAFTVPGLSSIPLFYSQPPYLVGCEEGDVAKLDRWEVIYRTDANPSFSFQVEVPDVCQARITNTASVSTSSPQVTSANDSSTVETAIDTTDVKVAIDADRGSVLTGENINYTITVTNSGPGVARGVVAIANLPNGDGVSQGTRITRNFGTIPVGESRTFTGSVNVNSEASFLPLVANASVTTTAIDCNLANNTSSTTTLTGNLPSVFVRAVGPANLTVGGTDTWVVSVANKGNTTATDVVLTIPIPTGGTLVDVFSGDTENVQCTVGATDIVCTIGWVDALEQEGFPIDIELVIRAGDCTSAGGRIVVAASVVDDLDPDVTDNGARVETGIIEPAGRVSLRVFPGRSTVETGDVLPWHVHYRNVGTRRIDPGTLTATVPAGTTLIAGTLPVGATVANGVIMLSVPGLDANASGFATFSTRVTAQAGTTLSGTATFSAAPDVELGLSACPATAPYASSVTSSGLHVVKQASAALACGQPIDWTITVTNTSPNPQEGFVVTDRVAAESPYVSGTIKGPGASAAGTPVLTWQIGTLAPGKAVTLGYRTQPPASTGALVSNVARVERNGTSIVESAATVVRADCASASFRLNKAWNAGCGQPGETVEIELTAENTGTVALTDAVVRDPVLEGLTFVSAGPGLAYDDATRTVSGTLAPLLPGQRQTLRYRATLAAAAGRIILDVASLSVDGFHPQSSNQVSGVVVNCDDGNRCTTDRCELFVGCVNTLTPIPNVTDAQCDGVDDDCDARTDEDYIVVEKSCGLGECRSNGALICPAGATHVVDTCVPKAPLFAVDAVCDGKDEDCSGAPDEDYASRTITCGEFCAGQVPTSCEEGREVWTCTPRPSGVVCDDGNACSDASTCDGQGRCAPRRFISCTDDNACTSDTCDPTRGCVFAAVVDGQPCDDFNECTIEDSCRGGVCGGAARACAAPGECQLPGTCNPATGVCDYGVKPGDVPVPIRLTDLGTLGGATSTAVAISRGVVVGAAATASGDHAFAWTSEGGMVDLTPGSGITSAATGVNASGLVVGTRTVNGVSSAWSWTASGGLVQLFAGASPKLLAPRDSGRVAGSAGGKGWYSSDGRSAAVEILAPAGGTGVEPLANNDGGVVVGRFMTAGGAPHGFWWTSASGAVDLAVGAESDAVAVNAAGLTVGWAASAGGDRHAWVFRPNGAHADLGTLGGDASWAVAVNDAGLVIGQSETATGAVHAFAWTEAAGMIDLGAMPGGESDALYLNALGSVVGTSSTAFGTTLATLWSPLPEAALTALDLLGGTAASPIGLTDSGLVAGNLETSLGSRAFVWQTQRGTEDLGTLGGATAEAKAVSEDGRVVGEADVAAGSRHAFVSEVPRTACVVCDEDLAAPVIICPVFRRPIECAFGGVAVALGRPSVNDACGEPVTVSDDAPETYALGATPVTWTARDTAGNAASCTTTVQVNDTLAPVVTCPATLVVQAEEGVCGATVTVPVTAADACDGGSVPVTGPEGPASQPLTLPNGTTTVTFTAVDRSGQIGTCVTEVTVRAFEDFHIDCDADLTVEAPADHCGYPEALTADLVDACNLTATVTSAIDNFPIGLSEVTFSATNDRGGSAECVTKLTVVDATAPVVDCNTPSTLPPAPAFFVPTASDACGVALTVSDVRCLVKTGETETVVTEKCGATVRDGNVVFVGDVPDGDATVVFSVAAEDPSGNRTVTECRAKVDATVLDRDKDGIVDGVDNCIDVANADQVDSDIDGVGDACDDTPYDGLTASGSGGCAGGGELGLLAGLVALGALIARRRLARR